ncbi:hypothetical protein SLEP1_g26063 [Rubroshorea leprosula]|uniref:Uncharacterized protein n=1 Tax=Rubroshorea leprosula TaxID=152421 RepID=A0AAV5JNV5_9ROSI|nr:hypothetical protein SLEP1_g26063 [Rubroshorea leprosula]
MKTEVKRTLSTNETNAIPNGTKLKITGNLYEVCCNGDKGERQTESKTGPMIYIKEEKYNRQTESSNLPKNGCSRVPLWQPACSSFSVSLGFYFTSNKRRSRKPKSLLEPGPPLSPPQLRKFSDSSDYPPSISSKGIRCEIESLTLYKLGDIQAATENPRFVQIL